MPGYGGGGESIIGPAQPVSPQDNVGNAPPAPGIYAVTFDPDYGDVYSGTEFKVDYTCLVTVPSNSGQALSSAPDYPAYCEKTSALARSKGVPTVTTPTSKPKTPTVIGEAIALNHAYSYFPGTAFDSTLTRSYARAQGTVTVPSRASTRPGCLVSVTGLHADVTYAVYAHAPGIKKDNATSTAGPWPRLGTFVASSDGTGAFECTMQPQVGSTIAVNAEPQDGMILISSPLP